MSGSSTRVPTPPVARGRSDVSRGRIVIRDRRDRSQEEATRQDLIFKGKGKGKGKSKGKGKDGVPPSEVFKPKDNGKGY